MRLDDSSKLSKLLQSEGQREKDKLEQKENFLSAYKSFSNQDESKLPLPSTYNRA